MINIYYGLPDYHAYVYQMLIGNISVIIPWGGVILLVVLTVEDTIDNLARPRWSVIAWYCQKLYRRLFHIWIGVLCPSLAAFQPIVYLPSWSVLNKC